jgi:hypothetical protein
MNRSVGKVCPWLAVLLLSWLAVRPLTDIEGVTARGAACGGVNLCNGQQVQDCPAAQGCSGTYNVCTVGVNNLGICFADGGNCVGAPNCMQIVSCSCAG